MKSLCRFVAIAISLTLVAGCAGKGPAAMSLADAESAPATPAAAGGIYHIGPDDQLRVDVWRNPDLSVTVPVRPDGMISVPLIGDVKAGGRTPEDVAGTVEQRLAKYIRQPKVTVIVTELNSNAYLSRVRVTGAVKQPVSIPYRPGMTVLDVVLQAGGITDFAAPARTHLYRRVKGQTRVLDIDLDGILSRGELDSNVRLLPGDVIAVPERLF